MFSRSGCLATVLLIVSTRTNGLSPRLITRTDRSTMWVPLRRSNDSTSLTTRLNMQPQRSQSSEDYPARRGHDLAASTVSTIDDATQFSAASDDDSLRPHIVRTDESTSHASLSSSDYAPTHHIHTFIGRSAMPVLSASMMVTGNTVGAGMLVLPELSSNAGGLGISTGVMCLAWFMNLVSGLTIAQVAIRQHEVSGMDVPSSFKEFAEATLPQVSDVVSSLSIFINVLILAFDCLKAGQVGDSLFFAGEQNGFLLLWTGILGMLVSTQSLDTLSRVAGILVIGLFSTFSGLLLPGLGQLSIDSVSNALNTELLLSESFLELVAGISHLVPVAITTLVFQNVVPTVTRMLDYDRRKVSIALISGSFVPLVMYITWCMTFLGGGIDTASMSVGSGLLLSVFSLITVGGSSLGSLISLSEEMSIILGHKKSDSFSVPSVAIPLATALLAGQVFSSDITELIRIAGSYGSPLLYGIIPVAMAVAQSREGAERKGPKEGYSSVIPGGIVGLTMLGFGSTALVGSELLESVSQVGTLQI